MIKESKNTKDLIGKFFQSNYYLYTIGIIGFVIATAKYGIEAAFLGVSFLFCGIQLAGIWLFLIDKLFYNRKSSNRENLYMLAAICIIIICSIFLFNMNYLMAMLFMSVIVVILMKFIIWCS